ncbi:hypothetical protein CGI04_06895 [Vibrio parahaemolyticus]|uniref:hypothetical protein n=1 Tax=Vibrio parahaemolyticus TaxID=670 RepID=UPI0004150A6F|nr:hypothetical protein [Vibrio parahaemolyticus]TOL21764.1 hypothetical protein CGI04_06895 [Vibrio parahaemolyticus]
MAEIFFYSNNNRELISEHTTSKRQALESELSKIEQWITQVEKNVATLDTPASLTTTKEVTEALMAASVYQKQIVVQMVSSNPEDAIALSLAASIEAYGEQLENINAWTQGGSAVINACLDEMFENLIVRGGDGFSNCELEDLFQLALISMMCNPDEYPGMDELLEDPEFVMHMGRILEFTGSGSHKAAGIFEGVGPSILKESYEYIYSSFEKKGIPAEGTFAYKCLSVIEKNGGLEELKNGMTYNPYMTDGEGWATNTTLWGGVTAGAKYLSPANTLIVLGYAAGDGEATAEQWDEILSCNLETMDNILDVEDKFDNIYEYLVDKDPEHWAIYPDGSFDFLNSAGISQEYLNEVFGDFPPRELTEEEIEEVNRIGDQVKMLQQTLLYWLKICRDEQMAMAQNI